MDQVMAIIRQYQADVRDASLRARAEFLALHAEGVLSERQCATYLSALAPASGRIPVVAHPSSSARLGRAGLEAA